MIKNKKAERAGGIKPKENKENTQPEDQENLVMQKSKRLLDQFLKNPTASANVEGMKKDKYIFNRRNNQA